MDGPKAFLKSHRAEPHFGAGNAHIHHAMLKKICFLPQQDHKMPLPSIHTHNGAKVERRGRISISMTTWIDLLEFSSYFLLLSLASVKVPSALVLWFHAAQRLPTLADPAVPGLQCQETRATTASDESFWELQTKKTWLTQGWEPPI